MCTRAHTQTHRRTGGLWQNPLLLMGTCWKPTMFINVEAVKGPEHGLVQSSCLWTPGIFFCPQSSLQCTLGGYQWAGQVRWGEVRWRHRRLERVSFNWDTWKTLWMHILHDRFSCTGSGLIRASILKGLIRLGESLHDSVCKGTYLIESHTLWSG